MQLLPIFSLACAVYAFRYFGNAFPIASLSITADQHAVRTAARSLHEQLQKANMTMRPTGREPMVASSFQLDKACQHFVERRGGGNSAFSQLLSAESGYSPFTWHVRHFLPSDPAETRMMFKPDGNVIGFVTTLPEDEPALDLSAETALEVATISARAAPWHIDFSEWVLKEQTREAKPHRADHTFTYERPAPMAISVVEDELATYRLTLTVSGGHLSALRPGFKVPEAFTREFDGMRSANEALLATYCLLHSTCCLPSKSGFHERV